MNTVLLTLCIIHEPNRVLLAMKKRGFGAGRWNGFGGKVEAGESIVDAALRECLEEGGITPLDLTARGVLTFTFENRPEALEVHLFGATTFEGEPTETEEMRPQWFAFDAIPFDAMWPDDRHWLPRFLSGENLQGSFHFRDENTLLSHELRRNI